MRLPLRHDSSSVEHDDLVAQRKYFFATVGDKKNRNAVMLVPLAADRQRADDFVGRSSAANGSSSSSARGFGH